MPHYDESFIHDDILNQRRNKRSYAVYKHGLSPLSLLEPGDVLHALEERSTNVIKRNIRNIKQRGSRTKPQNIPLLTKTKNPDIITDHCPRLSFYDPKKYYDIRNNNVSLVPCKSLDNLSIKQVTQKNAAVIRSGASLQSLLDEERLQHYSSTPEDRSCNQGRGDARSYYFNEDRQKPQRRYSRGFAAPGVGVYRQINTEPDNSRKVVKDSELSSSESGSGHRGSLRGANKLARRARSFKDDLLERISNMRSPQQPHAPHLSSAIRSHSPLSPKPRNIGLKHPAVEETELTPAKEMERLVKDVTCGLKHFSDVITKKKLEMLPGNGTLVFESIANIHKAIKPYCSRSPQLTSAVKRLCSALATLIRLCDDVTAESLRADAGAAGEGVEMQTERVVRVVRDTRLAVEDVAKLAEQHMSRPALSPRPALVSPRATTQRNSLPDIPLTPKEMCALGAAGGAGGAGAEGGVRASHSSESVLDAPQLPPPKPARITRKIELAPPLPPKRKSANENNCQNNLYVLSSIDRTSFQSHSSGSGSLESMMNASHDDESRALGDVSAHESAFGTPTNADAVAICSCNNLTDGRTSLDSSSIDSAGHEAGLNNTHTHSNFNHNRFSNESGFVSVGHAHELSAEHNVTAYSTHSSWSVANSTFIDSTLDSIDCAKTEKIREQTNCIERRMNVSNANSLTTTQQAKSIQLSSVTSSEDVEQPPELPVKTRRANRADVQQHFPNVEIRQACTLHGEVRPHTMADHHPPRPPPLPLKKKHMFQSVAYSVMAYMEMFGKQLEENKAAAMASAHPENSFRHSIHTSNLASVQHTSIGGISMQRQHVQQTIAQSLTLQHIGTTALSGSEDSISMTSSGNSLAPAEPPALPPKMSKTKQVHVHSSVEFLPPPSPRSPRPNSYNSSADENSLNYSSCRDSQGSSIGPGKFPLEDELEKLEKVHINSNNDLLPPPSPRPSSYNSSTDESTLNYAHSEDSFVGSSAKFPQENQSERVQPTPSPVPSQRSSGSADRPATDGEVDIILLTDVSGYLACNDSPETVCGGHPEALVVLATKATKDFAYQEAFLVTYRTWLSPPGLMERLVRRCNHFQARPHELRSTLSLLTRVVADLTMSELDAAMVSRVRDFIYWLVEGEELAFAKTLRQILVDKLKQQHAQQNTSNHRYEYDSPCAGTVSLHRDTLLDFKASEIAEQMTLLDSELFTRITTAEVLMWRPNQSEELSPNLTRFTAHFNNMSFWARTRILEQPEARDRERYATKFLQVMKQLRKLRNFNSYLALVSALDSPPLHRLGWPRGIDEPLQKYADLINMDGSFRKYRQVLADTQPPCIPYIGIVLQDLTFVHAGNPHLLADGKINFSKRWQQYHLMENMKRFQKEQYKFRRNGRIQAMFNEFDDVLSEEALWQISTNIKPTGGDR